MWIREVVIDTFTVDIVASRTLGESPSVLTVTEACSLKPLILTAQHWYWTCSLKTLKRSISDRRSWGETCFVSAVHLTTHMYSIGLWAFGNPGVDFRSTDVWLQPPKATKKSRQSVSMGLQSVEMHWYQKSEPDVISANSWKPYHRYFFVFSHYFLVQRRKKAYE